MLVNLNNLKSILLLLVVAFGSIYTFSLDPAPGIVLDIKRAIVVLFVMLEMMHIAIAGMRSRGWFSLIVLLNILFVLFLGNINSGWYQVVYQVLSLMFVLSVFSHISRFSMLDVRYFLSMLRVALFAVTGMFIALLFLYYLLDSFYAKRVLVFGFGNDYANFSVWSAYVSLLVTYLYVRLQFMKREYFYFQAILLGVVALAGGRTGGIMILGGLFVGLYYGRTTSIDNVKIVILAVAIAMLIYLFGADSMLLKRFFNMPGDLSFEVWDRVLSGRLTIANEALLTLSEHYSFLQMIWGMGLNNVYFDHLGEMYQVHNFILRSLMETGIIGMVLMLMMYLYPFFARYAYRDKALIVSLYLIASLNAMVSPASFYTNANISGGLWVLIALSFQMNQLYRERFIDYMVSFGEKSHKTTKA